MDDYLLISYRNLKRRKLRSWLTMLGIFIGIALVISLISLGDGLQNAINKQFERLGSDRILVLPGGASMGPMSGLSSEALLYDKDLNEIRKLKEVKYAVGTYAGSISVTFKGETKSITVFGFDKDKETQEMISTVSYLELKEGRTVRNKNEVVLGLSIAEDTFKRKLKLGDKIKINDRTYTVVGIQKRSGTGVHDKIIRMNIDELRELLNVKEGYSTIFVKVKKNQNVNKVKEKIKEKLRKERGVEKGKEDFNVETSENVIKSFLKIIDTVKILLVAIATISLVVGGIGIMNTMYTSVLERRKEIGIMKSIGAKNRDILKIFLIESGLLGLVGGIIGIIIGYIISKSIELATYKIFGYYVINIYLNWTTIIGVLIFSFLIGSISGILPSLQASRLNPVEAMKD